MKKLVRKICWNFRQENTSDVQRIKALDRIFYQDLTRYISLTGNISETRRI
jgi:hypothetical protein